MYYLLDGTSAITQIKWTEIILSVITAFTTLTTAYMTHKFNKVTKEAKKKEQKAQDINKIDNWASDINANEEIQKRLARIKNILNAERVCLFVNHNGVADAKGTHLKRFSAYSFVQDSQLSFDPQRWHNQACSIYNEFFKVLLEDGKVEIPDTENDGSKLGTLYNEWGYKSMFSYPIIFENTFWGFVTGVTLAEASNIEEIDNNAIQANIDLIIKTINI